jgi:hypothetical protein
MAGSRFWPSTKDSGRADGPPPDQQLLRKEFNNRLTIGPQRWNLHFTANATPTPVPYRSASGYDAGKIKGG